MGNSLPAIRQPFGNGYSQNINEISVALTQALNQGDEEEMQGRIKED